MCNARYEFSLHGCVNVHPAQTSGRAYARAQWFIRALARGAKVS